MKSLQQICYSPVRIPKESQSPLSADTYFSQHQSLIYPESTTSDFMLAGLQTIPFKFSTLFFCKSVD